MSAHSIRKSRITGSLAAASVAVLALLFGASAPAAAEPPEPVARYVALGDSYAAGQGAGLPLDGCLRSTAAYPVLLDAEPRINLLRHAACSGATIETVMATQLSQVNRGTTLVTLTVGANDLGAGAVYAACAPDPASTACDGALAAASARLAEVDDDLAALIGAIAERAPDARIVVTDYPIPFVTGLSDATDLVNAATAQLAVQIATGAFAAGYAGADVVPVSVATAFVGHQVGTAQPWLGANPDDPITFLHPTADGQGIYRDAIVTALTN